MGCDIHLIIEYRRKADPEVSEEMTGWDSFGRVFNPGRNYGVFGRLAGVRSYKEKPFLPLRGIPEGLSYWATYEYQYIITEDPNDEDGYCSAQDAARWLEHGNSKPIMRDGKLWAVTDPDAHSASWLTGAEYREAIAAYKTTYEDGFSLLKYNAVGAALESMEREGAETRVVFWFDN